MKLATTIHHASASTGARRGFPVVGKLN